MPSAYYKTPSATPTLQGRIQAETMTQVKLDRNIYYFSFP